ncbi:hypothetical protein O6H91_18G002200 [Diphasiastrum complanatum]|nr:hypothetical protein O6H91_18G002200 [Diphasiastrum complanatum]
MMGLSTTKLVEPVVHSMAIFFADRLADWHGLQGALLGSLALLKRSKSVGAVSEDDAVRFVKSALENLHVQALTQQDRILCLELLESLLGTYAAAVSSLGSDLVYGVCAAIEGETDPRCLLISFHIVELLAHMFPSPEGPVADCAEDLFDIISRYFPVSFTPPPNDARGITREDLATSLQKAFVSTPFFSSSCISLLLEKLSSRLHIAKIDSLKYLGLCALDFSGKVMAEFSKPIWVALKSELFPSSVSNKGIFDVIPNNDQEIFNETIICLRRCIKAVQNQGDNPDRVNFMMPEIPKQELLSLILEDDSVGDLFRFIEHCTYSASSELMTDGNISPQWIVALINEEGATSKARVMIDILSAVAQASCSACSCVLEKVLQLNLTAVQESYSSQNIITEKRNISTWNAGSRQFANLVALLLSTKVVNAANGLAQDQAYTFIKTQSPVNIDEVVNKYWLEPLFVRAPDLVDAYVEAVTVGKQIILTAASNTLGLQYCQLGVDGLRGLATFPAPISLLSSDQVNQIISFLTSILLDKEQYDFIWNHVLKAFSSIIATEETFKDFGSPRTYVLDEVIPQLLKALVQSKGIQDVDANLQAISTFSASRPLVLERLLDNLGDSISFWLPETIVKSEPAGDTRKVESILRCISQDLLPLCNLEGGDQAAAPKILHSVWSSIEALPVSTLKYSEQIMAACMEVIRVAVQKCNAAVQEDVFSKALQTVADRVNICDKCNDSKAIAFSKKDICKQSIPTLFKLSSCYQKIQETWLIALLASIVIAVRPGLLYLQEKFFLKLFLDAALDKRRSPYTESAAQALASILNKWVEGKKENHLSSDLLTLEDAINFVLTSESISPVKSFMNSNGLENLDNSDGFLLSHKRLQGVQVLSWVGKALAMRGDVQVKDIAVLLLSILKSSDLELGKDPKHEGYRMNKESEEHEELTIAIATAAAEGLGIIIKESKALNKKHYATVRPLYKQRFLCSMLPLFFQALREVGNFERIWLLRGLGHLISETPHTALMSDVQLVLPLLLEALPALSKDSRDMNLVLAILLVLSSFLVDTHYGRNAAADHVANIVTRLIPLLQYQFSMTVRETVLQCLGAVVGLPYSRVYPLRMQVLKSLSAALDDPKRGVRKEAVRCHRIWMAISSK